MKKLLLSILLMSAMWSCTKNNDNNPSPSNPSGYIPLPCATLQIGRAYDGFTDHKQFIDSILPTSYWSNNGVKKSIPLLRILTDSNGVYTMPSSYGDYDDSIAAKSGDVITLHIDLRHKRDSTELTESAVFIILSQYPNGFPNTGNYKAQFMCEDTVGYWVTGLTTYALVDTTISQTITYTIK